MLLASKSFCQELQLRASLLRKTFERLFVSLRRPPFSSRVFCEHARSVRPCLSHFLSPSAKLCADLAAFDRSRSVETKLTKQSVVIANRRRRRRRRITVGLPSFPRIVFPFSRSRGDRSRRWRTCPFLLRLRGSIVSWRTNRFDLRVDLDHRDILLRVRERDCCSLLHPRVLPKLTESKLNGPPALLLAPVHQRDGKADITVFPRSPTLLYHALSVAVSVIVSVPLSLGLLVSPAFYHLLNFLFRTFPPREIGRVPLKHVFHRAGKSLR